MPRRVYEDEGRRYVVYRGETRDAPGLGVCEGHSGGNDEAAVGLWG